MSRGQTSFEYLLIIGGSVLLASVALVLVQGNFNSISPYVHTSLGSINKLTMAISSCSECDGMFVNVGEANSVTSPMVDSSAIQLRGATSSCPSSQFMSGITQAGDVICAVPSDAGASDWAISGNDMYSGVSGDVGIGIASPGAKLHVYNSTAIGQTANDSIILLTVAGNAGNQFKNNIWMLRDANGSTWQTVRLHDGISVGASFGTPGTDTRVWYERDPSNNIHSWGSSANTYMTISAGKVGINTTAPNSTLTVVGTAFVSGGVWTGSDARLKKNVVTIAPSDALDKVMGLRPVSFEWRNDTTMNLPEGTQTGFIAQEVEKVLPDTVSSDNGYKGVAYEKIVPVVAGAVQEQQKQIEELRTENKQLKAELCSKDPTYSWCK